MTFNSWIWNESGLLLPASSIVLVCAVRLGLVWVFSFRGQSFLTTANRAPRILNCTKDTPKFVYVEVWHRSQVKPDGTFCKFRALLTICRITFLTYTKFANLWILRLLNGARFSQKAFSPSLPSLCLRAWNKELLHSSIMSFQNRVLPPAWTANLDLWQLNRDSYY